MADIQTKRTFVTCSEHPHCQQEIVEGTYDDKPNSYVVTHHRDAEPQPNSPRAPEGTLLPELMRQTTETRQGVEGLEARLKRLEGAGFRERRRIRKGR